MDNSDILKEIKKAIDKDLLIVVEGKKDKRALEFLGFRPENILIINVKGTVNEFIEGVIKKNKIVAIMTDFDSAGKKLYFRIKRELVKQGIRIDDRLRLAMLKAKVSHVEGLATFIENTG